MAVPHPPFPAVVVAAGAGDKKRYHWWPINRKIVCNYVKEARFLIDRNEFGSALTVLDAALTVSPRFEHALELKARSLLHLRRFKDVADMLHDCIPSIKLAADHSSSSDCSDSSSAKLLSDGSGSDSSDRDLGFSCFSVSDLKKNVMAGIRKNNEKQGQWRYLVLGQACCHLGLMEDALVLLQTGKRMEAAAFRRESISLSDDSFTADFSISGDVNRMYTLPKTEAENITQLINHIKLLLRRKTSALAALDAGLYAEAIRHFSKIVDGRRATPQGFLAECYMNRATAYKLAGRVADSIADCNKSLSLNPTCIQSLSTRAALLETLRCLPDCLHDLEHLKLLYNTILRDRRLPGPVWKRHYVSYGEVPGKLSSLTAKIQELKQRIASGEAMNIDYYNLIGLRRGCSRSELDRAYLLLCLKHKPEKATNFVDKCEFMNGCNIDSVRDKAKMSSGMLFRLLQKGHTNLIRAIREEDISEEQRKRAAAALQATAMQIQEQTARQEPPARIEHEFKNVNQREVRSSSSASVYQGVFCRDLAVVGTLLAQVGFNRPLPLKYEALTC